MNAAWFTTPLSCDASCHFPTKKIICWECECSFVTIIIRLFLQRYDIHCFRVNFKAQITLRTVCGGRVWLSLPFAIVVSEQGSEGDTRTYHQIRGRIISWLWHWSHFCLQLHAVVSWSLDGLDQCCVVGKQ